VISVSLGEKDAPLRALCLGAHCDDIEIGCGGTILQLCGEKGLEVSWIVFSSDPQRAAEARAGAGLFLAKAVHHDVEILDFRERYFPYQAVEIKEYFDGLGERVHPEVIFTHFRDDRHQDHRLISELTYNTFRDHFILEYEIPKYDGDIGQPNCYVHIDNQTAKQKLGYIDSAFLSQRHRPWFSTQTFEALMRIRGIESRAPDGLAEAFHVRKLVIG
jgi:LmbE family N-acetylglucosaminyl deacetylase